MTAIGRELLDAFRSDEGRQLLAEIVTVAVERALRADAEARVERLEPLATILGVAQRTAAARLRRSSALRAIGVPVGKGRFRFRRSDVENFLRERDRAGAPSLRAVGG